MKYLKYIIPSILALLIGGVAYASTIPQSPTLFETYLANSQGSTDTTATLASVVLRDGSSLSGYTCLTIDANTPSLEYECGTLSGTTFTVTTRGIDAVTGFTNIPTLQFAHHRGADVKITDYPVLTQIANIFQNTDTIPNVISYVSSLATTTIAANRANLASVGLVQDIAFNGAGVINATTGAKGVIQIATGLQAASSTALGSSGASLALTSGISTSTGGTATSPLKVIVTNNAGVLDQSFLPASTTLPFTYGGSIYFGTASPTYAFDIGKHEVVFTTTGTSTWAIPTGIHTVYARVVGAGGAGGNGSTNAAGGGGGAGGYTEGMINVTATSSLTVFVGTGGTVVTNNTGNPGTQSTLATTTVVNGFIGGAGSGGTISPGNPLCLAGSGGIGSGGQFNSNGQNGVYGFTASSPIPNVLGTGGMSVLGQACGGGGSGDAAGSNGCVIIDY